MTIRKIYMGNIDIAEMLKERLGLDEDYIQHLIDSDDWTMMILSWALLETCLTFGITQRLGIDSARSFVEQLNIGGRSGKASLALSLNVITKADYDFIIAYSSVRNSFAHGIKRFKTTFDDYFASLPKTESDRLEKALPIPNWDSQSPQKFDLQNHKRELIFSCIVMTIIHVTKRK